MARIKNSPRQLGMVEFDDCALIELFPCAGRKRLMEATNSGKSVIEVNHKIPFLVMELKPEDSVAGLGASARSGLNCVGSQFVQTGNGRFHTFPHTRKMWRSFAAV